MAIYAKVDGINGSATEKDHKQWIQISSISWGVGRSVSTPTGAAQGREASQPSVSEVVITKEMDASSPDLFGWSIAKFNAKKVTIDMVSTGQDQPYLQYELDNAVVSGYSTSSGGDQPTESISFNFTKIQYKYTPIDEKNEAGTPVIKSYDIGAGKAS